MTVRMEQTINGVRLKRVIGGPARVHGPHAPRWVAMIGELSYVFEPVVGWRGKNILLWRAYRLKGRGLGLMKDMIEQANGEMMPGFFSEATRLGDCVLDCVEDELNQTDFHAIRTNSPPPPPTEPQKRLRARREQQRQWQAEADASDAMHRAAQKWQATP